MKQVMENSSHPRTEDQMCEDLWEQSGVAKALLWALLSLTVIQHLQLIKLSGVLVIKTKERSVTDLWNFPGLVFSFLEVLGPNEDSVVDTWIF